ncbi:hypothetical protein F8S13_18575 [Chloroflexia bacterium SDU3-3]|nr:hypothetical protein F8S13_18575 [Chloroflexia bacterium SDU3-3]
MRSTIHPLRMIFWGLLLCIIDFKIKLGFSGVVYRIDLLSDTIGMILVIVGVSRVASTYKGSDVDDWFVFSLVCAWPTFGLTILEVFVGDEVAWYRFLSSTVGLFSMMATALFCFAMHYVALDSQLPRSADRWKGTAITVLVWWVGAGIAANIIALAVHLSWIQNPSQWLTIQVGSALIFGTVVVLALLFCMLFLPLISFWRSTSHMQRELGRLPPVEGAAVA